MEGIINIDNSGIAKKKKGKKAKKGAKANTPATSEENTSESKEVKIS